MITNNRIVLLALGLVGNILHGSDHEARPPIKIVISLDGNRYESDGNGNFTPLDRTTDHTLCYNQKMNIWKSDSSSMEKNAICVGMIGLPIGVGLAAFCGIKNMMGLMAGVTALVAGGIGMYGAKNAHTGDLIRYGAVTTALTLFAGCLGTMSRN